jgi:uncharacterized membrane protein required for colicin V production
MDIAGLNTLDLLLLVFLFIGALVGAVRGMVPQVFSLASIWLGLVLTLWFYKPFSNYILQGLGLPPTGSDTISFLILFIVFFNAVRIIIKLISTPPEERKRKKKSEEDPLAEAAKSATQRFVVGPLNLLGGALLGIILMALWLAIILGVMQFLFQPADIPTGRGFSARMTLNLRASALLPVFNQILSWLVWSVSLFVPKNATILKNVLGLLE